MDDLKEKTFNTQIRTSKSLIEEVKAYALKTGANMNSSICILLDLGLKVANCEIIKMEGACSPPRTTE